jgi:hypothetical protein
VKAQMMKTPILRMQTDVEYAPTECKKAIPAALVHKATGAVVIVFDEWPKETEYALAPVFQTVIPAGKRPVGPTLYRVVGSHVEEVVEIEEALVEAIAS